MVALAALVVFLPSLGPMYDHHFAERMPYHTHVGVPSEHEHGYRNLHSHGAERSPDWHPALYELDISPTVMTIVLSSDADTGFGSLSETNSALRIPGPEQHALKSAYLSPPDRPPRDRPTASVSL